MIAKAVRHRAAFLMSENLRGECQDLIRNLGFGVCVSRTTPDIYS